MDNASRYVAVFMEIGGDMVSMGLVEEGDAYGQFRWSFDLDSSFVKYGRC